MSNTTKSKLKGPIKKSSVKQGTYTATLRGMISVSWTKNHADVSETHTLTITSVGMNGAALILWFMERDINTLGYQIDTATATVTGDSTTVQWKFPSDKVAQNRAAARSSPKSPSYYVTVFEKKNPVFNRMTSDELHLTTTLKILLTDDKSRVIANEPFVVKLSNDTLLKKTTNGSGKYEEQGIMLGEHSIHFSRNPLITPKLPFVIDSLILQKSFKLDILKENKFIAGSWVIKCSHTVEKKYRYVVNATEFAVVQDKPEASLIPGHAPEEKNDIVSIFHRKDKHLTEKNNTKITNGLESGFARSDISVSHTRKHDSYLIFTPKFWENYYHKQVYDLQGLDQNLSVKVYSPDKFQLTIAFPTPKKFETGAKYLGEKVTNFEEGKIVSRLPKKITCQKGFEGEQWGKLTHPLAIGTSDKPISLQVNGKTIELKAVDAFASVILLINKIQSIKDLVLQNIPKAGWYCSFTNEFLKGKIGFAWEWAEHSDHRVFQKVAAFLDFSLISVNFEIGVGFEGFNVVGQLYAAVTGEIVVSFKGERVSPDQNIEVSIPIKGTIEGALGARVKATVLIGAELKGVTGIEVNGAFKVFSADGPSCSAGIKWTGLKAKFCASAGVGKSGGNKMPAREQATAMKTEKEHVFVKEADLGTFKWPSEEKYTPPYLPSEQLKSIFQNVFTSWTNLRVVDFHEREIPLSKIIDLLVQKIDAIPAIDRCEKTITGIAIKVRTYLKEMYHSTGMLSFSAVYYDDFLSFCNKGEYNKILNEAVDSAKEMITKLS